MAISTYNAETHSSSRANPPTGSVDVDVSAADQTFNPPLRGICITVSGNVKFQYGGDGTVRTRPFIVTSGDSVDFYHEIKKIYTGDTTATILYGIR